MPVHVRPITLWRAEVDNQPGVLAQTLEPLAAAGADLQVVMGYRLPGGIHRTPFARGSWNCLVSCGGMNWSTRSCFCIAVGAWCCATDVVGRRRI